MKKIISALVVTTLLAGCAANGPQRGYYDENGNYHPAQSAVNADRTQTAAAVGLGVLAAGALAVGISAQHKANKADKAHHDDNDRWDRDEHRNRAPKYRQQRGSYGNPVRYEPRHHRGW